MVGASAMEVACMTEARYLPDHNGDCVKCCAYQGWDCGRLRFDDMRLKRDDNGNYIRGTVADKPVFIVECFYFDEKNRGLTN